jgi:hypothetical protein
MAFIGSFLKLIVSLGALFSAIFLGLKLESDKEIAERALPIFGVALSTFSPLGIILYVKYWELKPEFSSACGKQSIVGLICYALNVLLTYLFPPVFEHWTK